MRGPVQLTNQNQPGDANQMHIDSSGFSAQRGRDLGQASENQQFNTIQEQVLEDGVSDGQGTEIARMNQIEEQKIPYAAEKQAISNQLELASMVSDHTSVMNMSPVKSNKVMSTRSTKAKNKRDN